MLQRFGLLLFICFHLFGAKAQGGEDTEIDSLRNIIHSDVEDTVQVIAYNKLALAYHYKNEFDSAIHYCRKAIEQSKAINYPRGESIGNEQLGGVYLNQGYYEKAIDFYNRSLVIDVKNNFKEGKAVSLSSIGNAYIQLGKYDSALATHTKTLAIYKASGDRKKEAISYNNIGVIHLYKGEYSQALDYILKSARIKDELGDLRGVASTYTNIAGIYYYEKQYDKALEYYKKSLKTYEELDYKKGIAMACNNISVLYNKLKQFDKALAFSRRTIALKKKMGVQSGMADSYTNLGSLFTSIYKSDSIDIRISEDIKHLPKEHLLDSAEYYYKSAWKTAEAIKSIRSFVSIYNGLGEVYYYRSWNDKAIQFLKKSIKLADSLDAKRELSVAFNLLSGTYKDLGNYKNAYKYHKLYADIRDTLHSRESSDKIAELETKYQKEKKEQQIELLSKKEALQQTEIALQEAKLKESRIMLYGAIAGIVIVLIFAYILYNRFQLTRKQKDIIEDQKQQVDEAFGELSEKNKEITDSINYALRIQEALLKGATQQNKQLPPHFILFKPKDIVSGDFYWTMEKEGTDGEKRVGASGVPANNTRYLYIAAADCTGHGVPGAFLTMLGTSFLNEINTGEQLLTPAEILDKLRDKVIRELSQSGEEGESKDGMDISLARIQLAGNDESTATTEVMWAGANNPLWVVYPKSEAVTLPDDIVHNPRKTVENDTFKLVEISADKQAIGFGYDMKPFTNQVLHLRKGDGFYLFSDGYPDQFGGEKGKKLKYKPFKKLLLQTFNKPPEEQREIIDKGFEEWKGDYEQVDDVCVIGIKL